MALLRGINVGRAKRVRMADLRALFEELGFVDVRTLLNSGNLVFSVVGRAARDLPEYLSREIEARLGVSSNVIVLSATELRSVISENSLEGLASNPSRLFVSVPADVRDLTKLAPLAKQRWTPEALALGTRAAYVWCPDGILNSAPHAALEKLLGKAQTTRNWSTTTKLAALLETG